MTTDPRLSAETIARLAQLDKAATAGPWTINRQGGGDCQPLIEQASDGAPIALMELEAVEAAECLANAEFITEVRTALPLLLEEISILQLSHDLLNEQAGEDVEEWRARAVTAEAAIAALQGQVQTVRELAQRLCLTNFKTQTRQAVDLAIEIQHALSLLPADGPAPREG